MTYHPRDNATAHGPRDNVLPPATQLPRRSPDNVAGAPEPSSRRPHTPPPSPTHPATQPRTRHHRSDTPSDAAPHDVARAPEQSIRAPHSYPTVHQRSDTGRGAKHHRAPPHRNGITVSRHITAPGTRHTSGQHTYEQHTHEQHVRHGQQATRCLPSCRGGCLTALPPEFRIQFRHFRHF